MHIYHPHRDGHQIDPIKPIFYIIQHVRTHIYYAGYKKNKLHFMVRGSKRKTYTTSSKPVNRIIKEEGLSAFRIIRVRYFTTGPEAKAYEVKFLKRVNAKNHEKFYNESNDGKDWGRLGCKWTEDQRRKVLPKMKHDNVTGRTWFNDGKIEVLELISPGPEWKEGRLNHIPHDNFLKYNLGKTHWNNGTKEMFSVECPGFGWKLGRIRERQKWWTDGIRCKRARECPGEGWHSGRPASHGKAISSAMKNTTSPS
jgi:hypothetical protein